tara:strand:- start:389 stop:1261 length:873 start_codon:yes stop_codon:yes gene_type:complete
MKNPFSLAILGLPRSGTSMVCNLCIEAGFDPYLSNDSKFFGGSPFNQKGYFEEVRMTLLNDQLLRIFYGPEYSFLKPPSLSERIHSSLREVNEDFEYDINEETLYMPKSYLKSLSKYTGKDSDIWGLSRMTKGEKWYQGYKSFGVNNLSGVKNYLANYSNSVSKKNKVVKDPRLSLTYDLYNFKNVKLVIVERDFLEIENSIKNHYGPGMFEENFFEDIDWCSNHFNLKIKYCSKEKFKENYYQHLEYFLSTGIESFKLDYNKLIKLEETHIKEFENFIENKVNRSIISK